MQLFPKHLVIQGKSMLPTLLPKQHCLMLPYLWLNPKPGDVVAARDPRNGRLIVKRIGKIIETGEQKKYTLLGDDNKASTDSRELGYFQRGEILGKLFWKC